jgi:hypothetical protein
VPLTTRVPELPRGFDAVFTKLTFREPLLRYRTASALLEDLDRLENGESAVAERQGDQTPQRAQIRKPEPGQRRRRPPRLRS